MTEAERLKAEIEATRAELATTADALAAKLDLKAQAGKKVHAAGEKVSGGYANLRDSAPEPVQKALEKTGQTVQPLVVRAAADKRRTLFVLAGTALIVLIVRRVRR
jgi:malonyl CoA-acyl carrier protein transacylase